MTTKLHSFWSCLPEIFQRCLISNKNERFLITSNYFAKIIIILAISQIRNTGKLRDKNSFQLQVAKTNTTPGSCQFVQCQLGTVQNFS